MTSLGKFWKKLSDANYVVSDIGQAVGSGKREAGSWRRRLKEAGG
jgi:hypothetical protein